MKWVFLLPLVAGLNILLTSSDSWVSKNSRYLYSALVADGHNVVYVGPYHALTEFPAVDSSPEDSLEDVNDDEDADIYEDTNANVASDAKAQTVTKYISEGGDFGHLLPAHQKYFRYIRKLKTLARGARKVITKKDSEAFDVEFDSHKLIQTEVLGQDPLNRNFWYVDGSPLECLSIAFSEILPKYLPSFSPNLVIVGPNAGIHLSTSTSRGSDDIAEENLAANGNQVEAMVHLAQMRNVPAIAVSMEDHQHIYYENEDYFNVEEPVHGRIFKDNHVAQNIRFVVDNVVELVQKVVPELDVQTSLNVNFPSMNDIMSSCYTQGSSGPAFYQVVSKTGRTGALGKVVAVPTYWVTENSIVPGETEYYKVSDGLKRPQQLSEVEVLRMLHLFTGFSGVSDNEDLNSGWYNKEESLALSLCRVSVAVNHISGGNNLDESVLNVSSFL